jgi:hypothetical protein
MQFYDYCITKVFSEYETYNGFKGVLFRVNFENYEDNNLFGNLSDAKYAIIKKQKSETTLTVIPEDETSTGIRGWLSKIYKKIGC